MRNLTIVIFLIIALTTLGCSMSSDVENEMDVLEQLKTFDSTFESGFSISGVQSKKDYAAYRQNIRFDAKRKWQFTLSGDRIGYELVVESYTPPPRYLKNLNEKPAQESPDKEFIELKNGIRVFGGLKVDGVVPKHIFTVKTRQWGYWGSDLSGMHDETTHVVISHDGKLTEAKKKSFNSLVFGPRDEGPNLIKDQFLLGLGRFYSKKIDQILEVKKVDDEKLFVVAKGKKSEQFLGRWELLIDPNAAWMVQGAKFFWVRRPDRVMFEMKNSGVVWSGSHCIPSKTSVNYSGALGEEDTVEIVLDPKVEGFNDELYESAKRAVALNKTPALTLFDHRVSPPVVSEPFRTKPVVEEAKEINP